MSFRRLMFFLPLAAASLAQVMTAPTRPVPGSSTSSSASQIDPAARDQVAADLRANKLDEALTGAKSILAAHPESAQANKLIGVVLLAQQKAAEALPYFQKALGLDANDVSIHFLLVQAYAQSGDVRNRDAERALLRGFHSDGKHPELAKETGFPIETIPFSGAVVQAFEYFEPVGQFHFYYRFNVFDANGHLLRFYALESDDGDQAMFAQQHPKEAAAGGRRFSIDVYALNEKGNPTQGLITFLDGQPTYDDLRARIVRILDNNKPAPGQ